jgi:hypothetical protein
VTHFNDGLSRAACGAPGRSGLERDPARVSCEACKGTILWSRAWRERLEGMRK